ncbi:hypothetical protein F4782DRAFT_523993 [Xylaria castorea]|nr:hypothetical protein F4782DRAFT_523993 [Xylaria castorea]
MTDLDKQHATWDNNPLRRAVDRLSQIPSFFGPVAASTSASASTSTSTSTSIPWRPDRQASSQYKRICPALGFSTWTGRFLLGSDIEGSRQSMQLLSNALKKWHFRLVSTTTTTRSRIPPSLVVPPEVTVTFLRRLEQERLADGHDLSASWEPGALFPYQPRHVEKAVEVFAHENETGQEKDQESGPAVDESAPEIGRACDPAAQHRIESTPLSVMHSRLSSAPDPEPGPGPGPELELELEPELEPDVEVREPLLPSKPPSPLPVRVESSDEENENLGFVHRGHEHNDDEDDYNLYIPSDSSMDQERPGRLDRSVPLSSVTGKKRSRSTLEHPHDSNHDTDDVSPPLRQRRVGADDPTPEPETAVANSTQTPQECHGHDTDAAISTSLSQTPRLGLESLNRAIETLKPGEWLNDDAVNFAIHQLVADSRVQSSFTIVPSHLSASIIECSSSEVMDKLVRRYNRLHPRLPNHLLIPVHWPNHWALFHWDGTRSQLTCFDSMRESQDRKLVGRTNLQLRSFLGQLYHRHHHQLSGFEDDDVPSQLLIGDCPRQDNGFDCGIWVITNAHHIISTALAMSSFKGHNSISILCPGPTTSDSSNRVRSFFAARFLTAAHAVPPSLFDSLDPHAEQTLMRALILRKFPDGHSDGQSGRGNRNNGIGKYQMCMAAVIKVEEVSNSPRGERFTEEMHARLKLIGLAAGLARLYATHSRNFERLIKTRESLARYRRQRDVQQSYTRKVELLKTCASKLLDVSHAVAAMGKRDEDIHIGSATKRPVELAGCVISSFDQFDLATESVKHSIVALDFNVQLALKLAPRFESKAENKNNAANCTQGESEEDSVQVELETDVEDARVQATVSLLTIHYVAVAYTQIEAGVLELKRQVPK